MLYQNVFSSSFDWPLRPKRKGSQTSCAANDRGKDFFQFFKAIKKNPPFQLGLTLTVVKRLKPYPASSLAGHIMPSCMNARTHADVHYNHVQYSTSFFHTNVYIIIYTVTMYCTVMYCTIRENAPLADCVSSRQCLTG